MQRDERIGYLIDEARRADPDRFLCTLFAPAERREPLLALLLLDAELARVPRMVRQPMAGLIRYQWWREAIAGAATGQPRAHPVVEGLAAGLAPGWLAASALEALVDAREPELEDGPPADPTALERHLAQTAGAVQALTAGCLDADATAQGAARLVGTAYGLAASGAQGRERAAALLEEARRLLPRPPRALMAAFLPARFARAYLRSRKGAEKAAPPPPERPRLIVLDLLLAALLRRY